MTINFKTLALLIPVFVSFFWFLVLISRNPSKRQPGFYIAMLMGCLFLLFTSIIPFYTGNLFWYGILDPFFFLGSTLIFPLIWLYVRSISERKRLEVGDYPHFVLPLTFTLIAFLSPLSLSPDELEEYAHHSVNLKEARLDLTLVYINNILSKIYILFQAVFYFHRCYILIRSFIVRTRDYFADLERRYFNWIRMFFFIYISSSIPGLYLLFTGNEKMNTGAGADFILIFILLSMAFFLIGFIANHQRYLENGDFYLALPEQNGKKPDAQWQKSKLGELDAYFESQKPYLDPDLKITDVAQQLKTNRTYLSCLIHDQYGYSFRQFVNKWRIEEVIKMFRHRESMNYSTRGISENCGFNNYNTFSSAFRSIYGVTPARYREQIDSDSSGKRTLDRDQNHTRVINSKAIRIIKRKNP